MEDVTSKIITDLIVVIVNKYFAENKINRYVKPKSDFLSKSRNSGQGYIITEAERNQIKA